jgi:predicted TIM-barrel fold metal-dependent hydrolase
VPAIAAYPRVQFLLGHAGARDVGDALAAAAAVPERVAGDRLPGCDAARRLMSAVGPERLLFGSDWPFYPLAATLAKVLLVTEGKPDARAAILGGNAERMFAAAHATRSAS